MIPTTHITIIFPDPPPGNDKQKSIRARLIELLRELEASGAYVEIDDDSEEDISGAFK